MKPETRNQIAQILAESGKSDLVECFESLYRGHLQKKKNNSSLLHELTELKKRASYLEMRDRVLIRMEMQSHEVREMSDTEQARMIRENHLFFEKTGLSSLKDLSKYENELKGTILPSKA